MSPVISVEHVSKYYRLGVIGSTTLAADLHRTWARLRGKPDPTLIIGEKDYGNRLGEAIWALRDISFQVEQGETLGIIGRNGAGKSTILKILSRVTGPTSGIIKVKGRIASLLEVGTGFNPELTGRENIYLNGAILGMSKSEIRRKFDEIVDFSEVEKFIDTPVKRYSSGMYVRLAFAVAAHLEPEILIVDEVLAVGDVAFQKKCLGKMSDVAGEGRTVLFVSHNMAAIQSLCRNSILLKGGLMVVADTTDFVVDCFINSETSTARDISQEGGGIITSIITADKDRISCKNFRVGDPIFLIIHIDGSKKRINKPRIGIGINTSFGQRICTVGTQFSTSRLPPIDRKTMIVCELLSPNMLPGEYILKVSVGDGFSETLVDIDHATNFEVVASDFFGNGQLPNHRQGLIALRSSWSSIIEDV